ncbi:hypothetical protein AVEN_104521-2-1, partial [Araneus ventricosus]
VASELLRGPPAGAKVDAEETSRACTAFPGWVWWLLVVELYSTRIGSQITDIDRKLEYACFLILSIPDLKTPENPLHFHIEKGLVKIHEARNQ